MSQLPRSYEEVMRAEDEEPISCADGEEDMPVDLDLLYTALLSSESSDTEEMNVMDMAAESDSVYLVYFEKFLELVKFCPECGSPVISEKIQQHTNGCMLNLQLQCMVGHNVLWQSQPTVPNTSQPMGNVALIAATVLLGNTYGTLKEISEPMKLSIMIMSAQTYCQIQRQHI